MENLDTSTLQAMYRIKTTSQTQIKIYDIDE
jgi:hypothetical protein